MTYAMAQTFGQGSSVVNVPATLPVSSIVKRLNELQPLTLSGYPSMISVLAREAQDGRLRIAPRTIWLGSEPVLPEMRAAIEATWGNIIYIPTEPPRAPRPVRADMAKACTSTKILVSSSLSTRTGSPRVRVSTRPRCT